MRERQRRRFAEDPEAVREYRREYRRRRFAENPEAVRAAGRKAGRRYYAKNRKALLARQRRYNTKNREAVREYQHRWYIARHPPKPKLEPLQLQPGERFDAVGYIHNNKLTVTVARACGLTRQAVHVWRDVADKYVLVVAQVLGVARHFIRPDLYPPDDVS